jgi:ATP-dependent Lon protease
MSEPAAASLERALAAIPVFPLPRLVLFPGALLPLHIFEPRYRAMLADSLATHRCIAMALVEDPGAAEPPAFARVAGAGIIVEHQPLPDGRSNIVLLGCARVRLEELPFVPPYRRARAQVLEDRPTPLTDIDFAALHAAVSGFVAEVRRLDVEVDFALPAGAATATTVDLCAQHLIVDADARQRALEELDVAARARFVTAELAAQTSRLLRERRMVSN